MFGIFCRYIVIVHLFYVLKRKIYTIIGIVKVLHSYRYYVGTINNYYAFFYHTFFLLF
jgi:hypothetical protein